MVRIAAASAANASRVELSAGSDVLLSLPHASPPLSYAALDLAVLSGACTGVSMHTSR